ncbi:DUF3244 domain-containing protein [Maribellus sp. CM-23]|uniref:DUF3244 domain-containing protein n=1 Tax=Maribellus sp. CM-23 TaxID=2781026 RepID=UPI001F19C123|nr:DUF3244 domain-containing protein [Maribellus sp. CM-23]MCE4564666.1 DUF3244 domain-containing protein [Maribellus sp. CM-23]
MKKLSLVLLILLALLTPNIGESSSLNLLNQSDDQKEIDLRGSLDETTNRSLQQTPIYASIGLNSLDVVFLYNIGIIEVEVSSESGAIVHSQSVDTQTQEYLSIDVSNWDNGAYEIRFTNSTGQFIYGTFGIE